MAAENPLTPIKRGLSSGLSSSRHQLPVFKHRNIGDEHLYTNFFLFCNCTLTRPTLQAAGLTQVSREPSPTGSYLRAVLTSITFCEVAVSEVALTHTLQAPSCRNTDMRNRGVSDRPPLGPLLRVDCGHTAPPWLVLCVLGTSLCSTASEASIKHWSQWQTCQDRGLLRDAALHVTLLGVHLEVSAPG